jgi:uncharacterized glyoxalase superfamily protein PhnB
LYRDVASSVDWLKRALGLEELFRAEGPGGQIVHVELRSGAGVVMVGAAVSDRKPFEPGPTWVYLVVDDPDDRFERAVAAGAVVVQPPEDECYGFGSRGCRVLDPEGHQWSLSTRRPSLQLGERQSTPSVADRPD